MVAAVFLITYAGLAAFLTVNALRGPSSPNSRFPALWLPAMLTTEMAPLWFLLRIAVGAVAVWFGATHLGVGRAGLWLLGASQLGLVVLIARSHRVARNTVAELPVAPPPAEGRERLFGRPIRRPEPVELSTHIPYHQGLTADLYRHRDSNGSAPTLIYVHGGSWSGGSPHRQARTLFHHLASRGWVVATIRYPLSPAATFPDHLIGVKRAIAWSKADGAKHGIDPNRIVIAGGSAGAHLASLAALTANRAEYQPGFESVDTSVRACVTMYGIYDFVNRAVTRHEWPIIPRHVMKAEKSEAPEAYRAASPLDQVHPGAPPFLVVHGGSDSLVPPPEAHQFVDRLRQVSTSTVDYLEVPGAQHGFDAISSVRTRAVTACITHFLESVVDGSGTADG